MTSRIMTIATITETTTYATSFKVDNFPFSPLLGFLWLDGSFEEFVFLVSGTGTPEWGGGDADWGGAIDGEIVVLKGFPSFL